MASTAQQVDQFDYSIYQKLRSIQQALIKELNYAETLRRKNTLLQKPLNKNEYGM
jgi:hypothetical protein